MNVHLGGRVSQLLEEVLVQLPGASQATHPVGQLAGLVDGELPLQGFIEQLLPLLCELYSAPAAVAWLKSQGAVFGVRYRMDKLLATVAQQQKHERLVQFAWQHKHAMLVEPALQAKDGNSIESQSNNPTDHRLLFAPIIHLTEPMALLEVVLPQLELELKAPQKQLYLRSLQLVAERVYGGLRRRMQLPQPQLAQASRELQSLTAELHAVQSQIKRTIEARLAQFQGWSFGSLAENQEFAKMLHQLLEACGMRVVCPECGHPAILRCLRVGNAKHGAFVFDHYLETGRTFHGGPTTVPLLKVIAKPARRTGTASSPALDGQ